MSSKILTKVKRIIGKLSLEEVDSLKGHLEQRANQLEKRRREAKEREAWEWVKGCKHGDMLYVNVAKTDINRYVNYPIGTGFRIWVIQPRKRKLWVTPENDFSQKSCSEYHLLDVYTSQLKPIMTDEARLARVKMRLGSQSADRDQSDQGDRTKIQQRQSWRVR